MEIKLLENLTTNLMSNVNQIMEYMINDIELEEFTSKLINIDYDRHTNYKLLQFSNDSIVNQGHIEEICKVNK